MADGGSPGTLAPLADVIAYTSADPTMLQTLPARWAANGYGPPVRVGAWLIAVRVLPGSRAVDRAAAGAGFAFTEGAERVGRSPGGFAGLASALRAADRVRPEGGGGAGAALDAMPGDVGFVWIDRHEPAAGDGSGVGGLAAARSAAGRVPVWWWANDDEACVGSRLADVAAGTMVSVLGDVAAAGLVAGQAAFYRDRSPIAGVNMLPPGSVLRLPAPGRGSPTVQRWFDPWPETSALGPARRGGSFDEVAHRFGDALRATLADELDDAGGNLLSLSGGVDSSTLAHLAASLGKPLAALSLVPDDDDPLLGRERSFIDPVVAAAGIDPHWARPLTMETRLEWLAAAPVAPLPIVHPVLCLLAGLRAEWQGHVLVGGEFCDEISGGAFAMVDWARTASPRELVEGVGHRVAGRAGAKRWLRYRVKGVPLVGPHRALPEVMRAEVREAWATWRDERHAAVAASPKAHAYAIELLASLDSALAMNWEVASSLGMRRVWPFLTREVIEIVASLRPGDLVLPVHKRLSRTAFRGSVPDRVLDRADTGAFGKQRTFEPRSFGALPESLAALFAPEVMAGAPVADEVSALAVGAGLQLARSLDTLAAR